MSDLRPAILGGEPVRPSGEPTWPPYDDTIVAALHELGASGAWGQYEGPYCERLEARLREAHHAEHVRLVASGTAAVEFALRGVGVGDGDEVILAGWDFKANFVNVIALGARPVLVDVCDDDGQLDVDRVEAAIGEKTRAVIASHLHGAAVDMPRLRSLADEHDVSIVEDVCQMPLAEIHGRPAGMWGDVGTLSFGGSKTLSAGRGGAVVTNSDSVAQRWQLHDWRGNRLSPLSEMQAAVLLPQLDRFAERHDARIRAAGWFRERFAADERLKSFPEPSSRTDYYKLPFWYDSRQFGGVSRTRLCEAVHAEGVTLSPSFPALHETHSGRRYRAPSPLVHSARAGAEVVVLHHPVLLEDEAEWVRVCDAVDKIHAFADDVAAFDAESK